ncbi:MAG TPA: siroheme synthase CysG [Dongiaceae bacterium]|nr:siroheme synthase CysG [Dongiaceae bacterium]
MDHFPIFLDLSARPALIVGGGELALRKLRLLRKAGARITVVAPRLAPEIEASGVALKRRGFVDGDVHGQDIIFAATGIEAVDDRVAAAARLAHVPFNVADRPARSSFILPAIVERDPVVVAISSGGAAPVLARRLREAIERLLPSRLGRLAAFANGFRGAVQGLLPDPAARRRFWERFFSGPVAESVLAGDDSRAREAMLCLVNSRPEGRPEKGIVQLVGTGPGNPDLLTLRALQVMQRADVAVHDRRIGPQILDLLRRDAERLDISGSSQEEVHDLLARLAGDGKHVVRLKDGDPFVFGRGGEELAALRRRGIAVQAVPGITAALGCAASVGLSLTHRDYAEVVTLIAGEGEDGLPRIDWRGIARPRQTLAVYMGIGAAGRIARRLVEGGVPPETPVAVIENGTLPDQRGAVGRLGALPSLIRESGIKGEAIIFVGEAVGGLEAAAPSRPSLALAG